MTHIPLPSKGMILEALAGTVAINHPVLQAAYELVSLHEARLDTLGGNDLINHERAQRVREIDLWTTTENPQPSSAAHLHTETVGMVIDRLAQTAAHATIAAALNIPKPQRHWLDRNLRELAIAYSDLSFEIAAGTRRLPDLSFPHKDSNDLGCGNPE